MLLHSRVPLFLFFIVAAHITWNWFICSAQSQPTNRCDKMHTFGRIFVLVISLHAWTVLSQDSNGCPNIIKRAGWSASKSTNVTYQIKPVQYVVIHHTATQSCNEMPVCKEIVKSIQDQHQKNNQWSDIGYKLALTMKCWVGWTAKQTNLFAVFWLLTEAMRTKESGGIVLEPTPVGTTSSP